MKIIGTFEAFLEMYSAWIRTRSRSVCCICQWLMSALIRVARDSMRSLMRAGDLYLQISRVQQTLGGGQSQASSSWHSYQSARHPNNKIKWAMQLKISRTERSAKDRGEERSRERGSWCRWNNTWSVEGVIYLSLNATVYSQTKAAI